jgi:hypothetical protein
MNVKATPVTSLAHAFAVGCNLDILPGYLHWFMLIIIGVECGTAISGTQEELNFVIAA